MTAQAQLPVDGFDAMTDAMTDAEVERAIAEHFTEPEHVAARSKPCRCATALVFADDDGEPRCAKCGRAAK